MEPKQVNIAIKKIKDIEFFVNEDIEVSNPNNVSLSFELGTNFQLEENSIELQLTAFFKEDKQGETFMKIKTSNVFLMIELKEFADRNTETFQIPNNIMTTLFSLSFSHTRALLAKNALGTKFADIYLPIINPTEMVMQLMGQYLEKKE